MTAAEAFRAARAAVGAAAGFSLVEMTDAQLAQAERYLAELVTLGESVLDRVKQIRRGRRGEA